MSNKVYKNFLFNKKRDKDILDWLESLDNQSEEIRKMLRAHIAKSQSDPTEPTLADVLDEVKSLSNQLTNIKIVQDKTDEDHREPPDLVAKLKNFGV